MRARAIFVATGIFRPADSGRTEYVLGDVLVHAPGYLEALRAKVHGLVAPAIAACAPFVPELRLDPKRYAFSFDLAAAEKSFAKPGLIVAGRQDTTVGYRDAWKIL